MVKINYNKDRTAVADKHNQRLYLLFGDRFFAVYIAKRVDRE